jgi:hypothetical protein
MIGILLLVIIICLYYNFKEIKEEVDYESVFSGFLQ